MCIAIRVIINWSERYMFHWEMLFIVVLIILVLQVNSNAVYKFNFGYDLPVVPDSFVEYKGSFPILLHTSC